MRPVRHPLLVLAVALLLLAAGTAMWRSAAPAKEDAGAIAAQLVCPACQGESVAQSQSPMAAAMRDTIAQQLAAGRSADQVRQWFVDRYGRQILADPPHGGLGVLLWLLPTAAAAAMALLFVRSLRRRAPPPAAEAATTTSAGAASPRRARHVWDAAALAVVALVGAVALAAPQRGPASSTASAAPAATNLVDVARSLEGEGRYAEAAQVYQDVVDQQPADDAIRLRLALTLLRANQPAAAATNARQVLAHAPGNSQALLMLGLAQRAAGSAEATATLRRFLAAAPQDPAAAEVRRLLAGR
jgi:cytochrome c-type biogenesis protein CcmH/NrfF